MIFINTIFLFIYLPDISSGINKRSNTDVLLFEMADNFNHSQTSDPVTNEMLNDINIDTSTSKKFSIRSNDKYNFHNLLIVITFKKKIIFMLKIC